ncbi:MAG: GDP-mannose 4,6-dehydratase [Chryseolinea sp.]
MHSSSTVLVTGSAGFIGFHLVQKLCRLGFAVTGVDNINDYYDPKMKMARLGILDRYPRFKFAKLDLTDRPAIN